MSDWWNDSPTAFDGEAYKARLAEFAAAREAETKRLIEEDARIEAETDPASQLRMRRERYECEEFFTVEDLEPWPATLEGFIRDGFPAIRDPRVRVSPFDTARRFPIKEGLNSKIFLHQGDITELEVDAIVNAANTSLLGGGGIDGAIHSAAGPLLLEECRALKGCETGHTKLTKGYSLPARFVLHTVGPFGKGDGKLQSCYRTCLELAVEKGIRTLAFCCVGTGIYAFPLVRAAHIALRVIRQFMDANPEAFDAVIFCVFQDVELAVYSSVLPSYFPCAAYPHDEARPEDNEAVPINEATLAAEADADRREAARTSAYYNRWLDASPDDGDEDSTVA